MENIAYIINVPLFAVLLISQVVHSKGKFAMVALRAHGYNSGIHVTFYWTPVASSMNERLKRNSMRMKVTKNASWKWDFAELTSCSSTYS